MNEIITAVELATGKVSVAVGEKNGDRVNILSHVVVPVSRVIRRGEVENAHKAMDALKVAVKTAEEEIGEPIGDIVLCLSSQFTRSEAVSVKKERASRDHFISTSELAGWQKEAMKTSVKDDEAIFDAIPQSFNIDDSIGINPKDVVGMRGKYVEGFYKIIIGKKSSLENKMEVAAQCNLNVISTTLSSVGSARAVLNSNESENGVAMLDIGAGTTDVVIVKNNIVQNVAVIPFGGQSITDDIKSLTCVTTENAELIKKKYGTCIEDGINENKKLVIKGIGGGNNQEIHLTYLAAIINARMSEIFEAAMYSIEQAGYADKIPAGLVLTGGTCYLENIKDLGKAITGRNVRLANSLSTISNDSVQSCFDTNASSIVGAVLISFDEDSTPVTIAPKAVTSPKTKENRDLFGAKIEEENIKNKKDKRDKAAVEEKKQPKKKDTLSIFGDLFSTKFNNEV